MDSRYFQQTGYRVNVDAFWDYYQKRGGVRTFGYPISREFNLLGFKVQMFQREVLQLKSDGSVVTMNMLDEGMMPYTRINSSTFPAPEQMLIQTAPAPSQPDYGSSAMAFVQANVPDQWDGLQVNFLQAFMDTVRYDDAFPLGNGDRALVPMMNLELWGLPTSGPAYDPNNHNFVYQRFQRGIMHYDTTTGVTQALLLADYLKSVITGTSLPPDLEAESRNSNFYKQYDPGRPSYVARPAVLMGSDLTSAFEQETVRQSGDGGSAGTSDQVPALPGIPLVGPRGTAVPATQTPRR